MFGLNDQKNGQTQNSVAFGIRHFLVLIYLKYLHSMIFITQVEQLTIMFCHKVGIKNEIGIELC